MNNVKIGIRCHATPGQAALHSRQGCHLKPALQVTGTLRICHPYMLKPCVPERLIYFINSNHNPLMCHPKVTWLRT
jgi:hypothetical protein